MPDKKDKKEKKRARGPSSDGDDIAEEDRLLEKLTCMETRIEKGFTKIGEEMAALNQEMKQEFLTIRDELCDLKKSLEGAWTEIRSLQEENKSLKEQMSSSLKENVKLNQEVNTLKDRIIKQEDYSRRENLRFYNIDENQEESTEQCIVKIKDVITALGLNPNEIRFHAIHRSGKRKDNMPSSNDLNSNVSGEEQLPRDRPRPILVRFVSRMDADAVWQRKKDLTKMPGFSSVFIDKDLSAESAAIRGKLRAAFRKAKELNNTRVFIKGNKLFVNSNSYEVDKLPDYLLPNPRPINRNEQSPAAAP